MKRMGVELEVELASRIGDKQLDRAATLALESYGAELHGFVLKDELRGRAGQAGLVDDER